MSRLTYLAALGLLVAAGCSDDATAPAGTQPPSGVVVLNGFGQPGITLFADSGTASTRLDLDDFDGSDFALSGDTLLTVSSKASGDLLFVADLEAATVTRFQLPGGSNPAAATLLHGGQNRFAAALRETGQVALLAPTGAGSATTTIVGDAGLCPTDVLQYGDELWAADANATCAALYESQGPMRLIKLRMGAEAGDTVELPGVVGSTASIVLDGDIAYVASNGIADYSAFPAVTFTTPGAVAKVDLATQRVVATLLLPQGTLGAGLRRGGDGLLYLTPYTSTSFATGVLAVDPAAMTFVVPAGGSASDLAFPLHKTGGGEASCAAATADALGRIYCVENATEGPAAATLYVFARDGTELRRAPAGFGAVAIGLR